MSSLTFTREDNKTEECTSHSIKTFFLRIIFFSLSHCKMLRPAVTNVSFPIERNSIMDLSVWLKWFIIDSLSVRPFVRLYFLTLSIWIVTLCYILFFYFSFWERYTVCKYFLSTYPFKAKALYVLFVYVQAVLQCCRFHYFILFYELFYYFCVI